MKYSAAKMALAWVLFLFLTLTTLGGPLQAESSTAPSFSTISETNQLDPNNPPGLFSEELGYGPVPRLLEDQLGPWEIRHTENFNIFSEPADRQHAEFLAESLDGWLSKALARVGQQPQGRVDLFITPNTEAFQQFSRRINGGRGAPPWAVGLAYPHLNTILVKSPFSVDAMKNYSLRQTTTHEIGHIILGWAVAGGEIPRWLHEGLAKYIAGETTWEGRARLSQAVLAGGLIPLRELNRDFPRSASGAALAYAQSLEFLSWLMDEYGPEVLQGLITQMGQGVHFEEAITQLTGEELPTLEDAWRRHLRLNFAWLPALISGGGLWIFASILLVIAYGKKRKERHLRRERWAVEEALIYGPDPAWNSPAAFWHDGPQNTQPNPLQLIRGGLEEPNDSGQDRYPRYEDDHADDYDDDGPPPGGWLH